MSENGKRYVYSGHAIGVAAHFNRLGETKVLNHVVPTLGAAVLPVTGGLSHSRVRDYDYTVHEPWERSLLKVRHVESRAHGREIENGFSTKVHSRIEEIDVLEKLHIDLVELNLTSTKIWNEPAAFSSSGNKIQGMRLGKVDVTVILDNDTLCNCASKEQLAKFYAGQDEEYRRANAWRFGTPSGAPALQEHNGFYKCSLVLDIQLSGPEEEVKKIPPPEGYKIYWPGFGRIYLAEVLVGEHSRRMTMVRLDMGSNAGGSGSIGDAGTNGSVST